MVSLTGLQFSQQEVSEINYDKQYDKHFQTFPPDPPECEVMTGYSQLDMQVSYARTLDCGCCAELWVAALTYHCIAMPGILYSSSMCQDHENHQTTGIQVCKC